MRKIIISIMILLFVFSPLSAYAAETSLTTEKTISISIEENHETQIEFASNLYNEEDYNNISEEGGLSTAFSNAFQNSGWAMIVCLILVIILIIILIKNNKTKKKRPTFKDELQGYVNAAQKHQYSGFVTLSTQGISYSRGNNKIIFDIPIEKNMFLAPFMVDDWFVNRNYNYKEAEIILSDISTYLTENRVCKSVKILSDEEYENLFDEYISDNSDEYDADNSDAYYTDKNSNFDD